MRNALLRMEYFETYYYANVINNVLEHIDEYLVNLHYWHEGREAELFLQPFPKRSVLHDFAEHVINGLMSEQVDDVTLDELVNEETSELWVDQAMRHHGIETSGFRAWVVTESKSLQDLTEDDIDEYLRELRLSGQLEELFEHLAEEVFFLLFANRSLLARLNTYISGIVGRIERVQVATELAQYLERSGIAARVHIPEWVRRAVFFRDRGMCAACNIDLSGLVKVINDKHFDHIVPLGSGGINDVTNIQLLCGPCNLKKGTKAQATSRHYEPWY